MADALHRTTPRPENVTDLTVKQIIYRVLSADRVFLEELAQVRREIRALDAKLEAALAAQNGASS